MESDNTAVNDSYLKNTYDLSFKIVLLGESGVGKSSIMYIKNEFYESHQPTLGIAYSNKIIERKNMKIKLEIWDTAGQERFKNIALMYYRKAAAIIIVFDITSKHSFEECKYWVNETENHGNPHCLKFLVGNKLDLENERAISFEEAKNFANKNGLFYMEVSAKTSLQITKLFRRIARFLSKRYMEHSDAIKLHNINNVEKQNEKKLCCL